MSPYDLIRTQIGERVPFVRTAGVELTEVGDGTATAVLDQTDATSNHVGSQHAGALYTLGETASGAAVAGALAPVVLSTRLVATTATIDYRAMAKGRVTARGRTERPGAELLATLDEAGKAVFKALVELTDADGKTVATMTVDWHAKAAKG